MIYKANAFSLQMIQEHPCTINVQEVTEKEFQSTDGMSCVGHEDTANILGLECNRVNITLQKGDVLFVAQLQGGRLPEGATTLPKGCTFKFLKVELN